MSDPKKFETTHWDTDTVNQHSAQTPRPKKTSRKRKFSWPAYVAFVLIVSALLAGIGWLLANDMCALNKKELSAEITIEEGDSLSKIAGKLNKAGIINNSPLFVIFGTLSHAKAKIDPGVYTLNTDMDYRCLITKMQTYSDVATTVEVTIPEGYTMADMFALLEEKGVNTVAQLTDAAANDKFEDYDFVDNDNLGDASRLEGYLFPDTYKFYLGGDPDVTIDAMLANFEYRIEDLRADIEASGHSLKELVIMASLIEKEAIGDDEERANISSVLYNRIHNTDAETAGFLQLDSTVYYAMKLAGTDQFSTEIDSPYNTYLHQGLPVGAICNPGLAAITAAIHPNDTNYYYFAYGTDGVSHFFRTLNEHLNFVNSSLYAPD
jgi:UPF0755 protein